MRKIARAMRAMPPTPPTTPPAIAATGVEEPPGGGTVVVELEADVVVVSSPGKAPVSVVAAVVEGFDVAL
jgi:hypothetical protein